MYYIEQYRLGYQTRHLQDGFSGKKPKDLKSCISIKLYSSPDVTYRFLASHLPSLVLSIILSLLIKLRIDFQLSILRVEMC